MAYPYAERLRSYREETFFALEIGEGLTLRAARNRLAGMLLTDEERNELAVIDGMVIAAIMELDDIAAYLINDDDQAPLTDWWWHLGKIRNKTYPAELLLDHLKAIYTETASDKKAT